MYGSAAWSDVQGRDLDILLVSPDLEGLPQLHSLELTRPSNTYLIPYDVFLEDVEELAVGGFYSHKFLFGFREINSIGVCGDVATLFWRRAIAANFDATRSPEQLIYRAQRYALALRPTLARSLVKFLMDDNRSTRLLDFVSALVRETTIDNFPTQWRGHPRHGAAAFHLFWREYARLKASGNLFDAAVRQKMQGSMSYLNSPLIECFLKRDNSGLS